MPLRDDYPPELRSLVEGSVRGVGSDAERHYAKALRLGILDPADPRVASEVIGRFAGSLPAPMLRGALLRRLRLAQEGHFVECYWIEDPS